MSEFAISVLSFWVGIASGFIGALSTGGGLISIPALIFMGLTPGASIATTRLSALSGGITAFAKYRKNNVILWKYIPYFVVLAVIGGIVGSKILLEINERVLTVTVGILLLLMLPLLFWKKNFGMVQTERRKGHTITGFILQFFIMIYGAAFGGGTGIFLTYVLVHFFGMTIIQANATGNVMWLVVTTTALISYILHGAVNFSVGIPLLIGAAIGGYAGAHTALKAGNQIVKWVFAVIIILSSIKLIFFP
ncbi:MAG: sulfite exporter TauE/SafE family protein [Candidatus Andersenbacteria bacterium]